jgi:hypothetical protein
MICSSFCPGLPLQVYLGVTRKRLRLGFSFVGTRRDVCPTQEEIVAAEEDGAAEFLAEFVHDAGEALLNGGNSNV